MTVDALRLRELGAAIDAEIARVERELEAAPEVDVERELEVDDAAIRGAPRRRK